MLASAAKAEVRFAWFAWFAADFFEHWRAGARDKLWKHTDICGSPSALKGIAHDCSAHFFLRRLKSDYTQTRGDPNKNAGF